MRLNKLSQTLLASALGLAVTGVATAGDLVCSPTEFGGKGDGETLSTQAIQSAIDKCAANGGVTSISGGIWLSGPLKLPSNTTLRIEEGTILRADNRDNTFVPAFIGQKAQDNEAFLLANGVSNVVIEGKGVIDGDGSRAWWPEAIKVQKELNEGNTKEYEDKYPAFKYSNGMPRPWLVEFNDSKNIKVNDVTLTNSPMWNLVFRNSQDILVNGVTIVAPKDSPNTDGIDIVSSQRVTVKNADIFSGDDNIAIKSGLLPNTANPSKDIVIEDSTMKAGHGISIGSETANGIGSVIVRNIKFVKTDNGVRVKTARDRGGPIGPIMVEDVNMTDVGTPLVITSSYASQHGAHNLFTELDHHELGSTTPVINGFEVNGLQATGATFAAVISGLPESPIKNLSLQHINIKSKYGIKAQYVEGALIHHHIEAESGDNITRGEGAHLKEAR